MRPCQLPRGRCRFVPIVGAILAVRFAMTSTAPPVEIEDTDLQTFDSIDGKSLEQIRNDQTPLWKRDIPGETPDEEPELDIRVEVDTSRGKNRMYVYISEAHGYYVETLNIDIWYVGEKKYDVDDSPLVIHHIIMNKFLEANDPGFGSDEARALKKSKAFVKRRLRRQIAQIRWGTSAAGRVAVEDDPVVRNSIILFDKALALLDSRAFHGARRRTTTEGDDRVFENVR